MAQIIFKFCNIQRRNVTSFFLILFLSAFFIISHDVRASSENDSLLGYWKFDGDTSDASGDGNTGNLSTMSQPIYDQDVPQTTFPNSSSLGLGGMGSFVSFPKQTAAEPTTALSFSFWTYLAAYPTEASVVAGDYLTTYNKGFFFTIGPAETSFSLGNGTNISKAFFPTGNIPVGTWVLLTGTWDGSIVKIYKNKELKNSAPFIGPIVYDSTGFQVGNYLGKMDEMRLYNRELSISEVEDLANGDHLTATWRVGGSTDYNSPNNWNINAIPDPYVKIVIEPGDVGPMLTDNKSVAGLNIGSNASMDIRNFNLNFNDGGIFSNNGTLNLDNVTYQTLIGFSNDSDSGTIKINGATAVGLKTGYAYNNLVINSASSVMLEDDLVVNGDLKLQNGTLDVSTNNNRITLKGNWMNADPANFNARQGSIFLNGTNQFIRGNNHFYILNKSAAAADVLYFESGKLQIIVSDLILQSTNPDGQFLSLRSSGNGTRWKIDSQGARNISKVDVMDSENINANAIVLAGRHKNSGNNLGWTFDEAPPAVVLDAVSSPTFNSRQPVTGTATESNTTVVAVEFQMETMGGGWSLCSADDGNYNSSVEDFTCTPHDILADGTHTMYVRSTDANNVTSTTPVSAVFTVERHTLTYAAGANGTLTGATSQSVDHDTNGTAVTATPNTGYHFTSWSDSSTQNPRTDTNVVSNISVTANFAINTYSLVYSTGTGGTLSGTASQTVSHGANGTAVTAVPNTGYHFTSWSDSSVQNPRTDSGVAGNISVTANFSINSYSLMYAAGANGTLTGTTSQTVNYGANGSAVTAVPSANYYFTSWNDGSTQNPRTDIAVAADISVTANFSINTYALNYAPSTNGTISGTASQTVSHGANGSAVTAIPNTNYHFTDWSDSSVQNPRTDTNVTSNISVTANFAIDTHTLTYIAGANGMLSGTTLQTVNRGVSGTAVTATPNTGYHFTSWSDSSTQNPRTDTNVVSNISVTANFAINTYSLVYSTGTGGTLSGTASQTVSHGANGTAVTAVPNTGYHFTSWSDSSVQNPRTDSGVISNRSIAANFAADTFTLKYKSDANGSLDGDTAQKVIVNGSGSKVEANPNTGYRFKEWSDGEDENPRKDENIKKDLTVTAEFEKKEYTLKYDAESNGTISGDTKQTIRYKDDGKSITAIADEGYRFTKWSDGSTQNPRSDNEVKEDISMTANFSLLTLVDEAKKAVDKKEETVALQRINFNGETTAEWQKKYFGSLYCYEESKCSVKADPDGDGVNNGDEFLLETNPMEADSDHDGLSDKKEVEEGRNPNKASNNRDDDKIKYENPKEKGKINKDVYSITGVEMVAGVGGKKSLKITGKALPNRFVSVYIYSNPIVLTVKTDRDGNWSYVLDKDLEDGEHQVYVAVTNSEGRISEKSDPLAFIKTAEAVTIIPPAEASASDRARSPVEAGYAKNLFMTIVIGMGALLIALFTIGFIKYKKNAQ